MVRIRRFEFLCRSMHIEPTINCFRVFYELPCSQGFYSFAQISSAKKILLTPPPQKKKSFHDWKPKFFFIKIGVIPMKMTFRGAEDIKVENLKTLESEIWHQDMKDIPSIELPKRALVAAGMSLHWKMDREDKPVYMEDDTIVSLYVVAYKREKGRMTTISKGANEALLYYQIIKNFALPKDEDLAAQPSTGAGPEKKKKRVPVAAVALKKADAPKAKVIKEEKEEPQDTSDVPPSNPDEPMDLDSSPEPLVRTEAVKRKKAEVEATTQPANKMPRRKIGKKGNLDAFVAKVSPEKPIPFVRAESSYVFNDDLPPSPLRASIKEQLEGAKTAEADIEKTVEVKEPVVMELEAKKVVEAETIDVGAIKPKSSEIVAQDLEKGKSIQDDHVITIPFLATTSAPHMDDVEKSPPGVDQGFIYHDEEDSPIHLEETLGDYYYRSYSEKIAFEIHAHVWKLKQGDTFSDWQICRDWLQGVFLPAEVKFQEERSHDQT
ncbi:hypothetical protein Hdeb2414_s0002g00074951 [Helianthus debilis subsp. tardiflorus]